MLAFVCLAIVWAFFLVPPVVRKHREGRPGSSVVDFRRQLSTLERATPGTSLKPLRTYRPQPVGTRSFSAQMSRQDAQRRRKNVLFVLGGAVASSLLLTVAVGGTFFTLLFLLSAAALGGYVYALVQLRMRADEAAAKVRVLRPQDGARPVTAEASVRRAAIR
jgi:hypothetical protein